MSAVLVGLSMDYEVFPRQPHARHPDPLRATTSEGLAGTNGGHRRRGGQDVPGFAAFVPGLQAFLKHPGMSMDGTAIALDATDVRMLLVPAVCVCSESAADFGPGSPLHG